MDWIKEKTSPKDWVTWGLLAITMLFSVYGTLFKADLQAHEANLVAHWTFEKRQEALRKEEKVQAKLDKVELEVQTIVRQTIKELKAEGVLK